MGKNLRESGKTVWRIVILLFQEDCSLDVRLMKTSSLQGIVRPPVGCLNPNSSSARLSKAEKEGWLKYAIGTTNLFLSISPT